MSSRAAAAFLTLILAACNKPQEAAQAPAPPPGPARGTIEWKIQSAMSAAPSEIARAATIMDYPATPTGQPTRLRAGTNGWTCFPDWPDSPSPDPVCLDGQFMNWTVAWLGHKPPRVTAVGIAYMLQGADDASNTDPFAMKPDSGKNWVHTGPHIMIIGPGAGLYAGMPTEPKTGEPFVMFPNTPYAHIMAPTQAPHAM